MPAMTVRNYPPPGAGRRRTTPSWPWSLPPGVVAVRLDPVPVRRLYALWRTEAARRPAIIAAVSALQGHGAGAGLS